MVVCCWLPRPVAARRDLVIQALAPKLGPGYEAVRLLSVVLSRGPLRVPSHDAAPGWALTNTDACGRVCCRQRLLLASHSLLAVAALGLLVLLARKSSRRVTVVALLAVVGVLSADRVFAVLVGTPGADGAGGPADAV